MIVTVRCLSQDQLRETASKLATTRHKEEECRAALRAMEDAALTTEQEQRREAAARVRGRSTAFISMFVGPPSIICPSSVHPLSVCPPVRPPVRLCVHLSICPSVHLSICPSVRPPAHQPACLPARLPARTPACRPTCPPVLSELT